MHRKVANFHLSIVNFIVALMILIAFMWYSLWVDKNYLSKAKIQGLARLQIQHPVMHCNPLDDGCKTNFTPIENLSYCNRTLKPGICNTSKCACRYLDEFDLIKSTDMEQRHFLLPTRITNFEHTMNCDDNCHYRYDVTSERTVFAADVESFTLMLDHSYYVEELGIEEDASECLGFAKFCNAEEDCGLVYIEGSGRGASTAYQRDWLKMQWDNSESFMMGMMGKKGQERTLAEVWREDPAIFLVPPGDVLKIGRLLEILGLDLDEIPHGHNTTLRTRGFTIVVDIEYRNFKEYSRPNKMPPIYHISFRALPNNEYKAMETLVEDSTHRRIKDVHGMYFVAKQTGEVGAFQWRNLLWMILEFGALMTFGKYLVVCCGLNFMPEESAEKLEEAIYPTLRIKHKLSDDESWDSEGSSYHGETNRVGNLMIRESA